MSKLHRLSPLLALAAISCGGETSAPLTPKITAFLATPSLIEPGTKSVLNWETSDAETVQIDVQGGLTILPASPQPAGRLETSELTETTTFVLTARHGESSSSKSVTVMVRVPSTALILRFGATPSIVGQGQSSTLSWLTAGVLEGEIRKNGAPISMLGKAELGAGTHQESIREPSTYVLAVRGADGMEVTAEATVTLMGPIVVSFTATPATITRGDPTLLAYTARNASEIAISGSVSGEVFRGAALVGQVPVRPRATETFTLVASDGMGGSVSDSTNVIVNEPTTAHIVSFTAVPDTITLGMTVELAWDVVNAPGGIEISTPPDILLATSTAAAGSIVVRPLQTTTYELLAINNVQGNARAMATVTLSSLAPGIFDFSAGPNPGASGGRTVLHWETFDASSVRVAGSEGVLFAPSSPAQIASGELAVALTSSISAFTLYATNGSGTSTATVRVVAQDPPRIRSFNAVPPLFGGPAATILWDVRGANTLSLFAGGAPVSGFPAVTTGTTARDLSGSLTQLIATPTVYELIAASGGGVVRRGAIIASTLAEVEPNETAADAMPLPGDVNGVSASLSGAGDFDLYAVMVPPGGHVLAITGDPAGGCSVDTVVELLADDGETVLASNDDAGGSVCAHLDWHNHPGARDLAGGTYFVRVFGFDGTAGSYALAVATGGPECGNGVIERRAPVPETCDDDNLIDGDGCDARCRIEVIAENEAAGNDGAGGAGVLLAVDDTFFGGAIDLPGDSDVYAVNVPEGAHLDAELAEDPSSGCANGASLALLDTDGVTELAVESSGGAGGSCGHISPRSTPAAFAMHGGTYFLRVSASGPTAYSLRVRLIFPGCGNGVVERREQCDDGDTRAGDGCDALCAYEIQGPVSPPGTWAELEFPPGGAYLIYALQVLVDGQSITATTADAGAPTCDSVDTDLELYDSGFRLLGAKSDGGPSGTAGTCGAIVRSDPFAVDLAPGLYYLFIRDRGGAGGRTNLVMSILDPACGNGLLEARAGEECDDGNLLPGDGCDASCRLEATLEQEPNDTRMIANDSGLASAGNASVRGVVSRAPSPDRDYFSFVVPAGPSRLFSARTYSLAGTPGSCDNAVTDTILTLEESNGNELASNDDLTAGVACSALDGVLLSPGTYFLRVEESGAGALPSAWYFLDLTLQ